MGVSQQSKPRPPKRNLTGVVLLNKPAGLTSNGVLQQVMRLFNAKKGGHTGALDPFATGLLPICLGEATKVSHLLLDADKRYIATLKLGQKTDTGDTQGEVIENKSIVELSCSFIEQILAQFTGCIEQIPPMYSALKHQGKPLYYYARQGIEIDRPARPVNIHELSLISFTESEIVFEVLCSKGTYVRTLGEDIAEALGTVGHLNRLHRTQVGAISGHAMLSLAAIEEQGEGCIQPLDIAIQALQRIDLTSEQAAWIQHGGKLNLPQPKTPMVRLYADNECIAIGEWQTEKALLKPKRVFNLTAPNKSLNSASQSSKVACE